MTKTSVVTPGGSAGGWTDHLQIRAVSEAGFDRPAPQGTELRRHHEIVIRAPHVYRLPHLSRFWPPAANIFSAMCDFVRCKQVSIAMARAGVPESWMTMLGILKAAGALGLLVGIGVPLIGRPPQSGSSCSLSVP